MTKKLNRLIKYHQLDILVILILSLTAPLFFYKLGQSSLVSWDEAWYAEIARNILITHNPIILIWNDRVFLDHPPTGYLLMAMSFVFLGINDFSARFASGLCGLLSLYSLYFLGKELFSRSVGLFSALALTSVPWFLYRARSGNLDVILTFFFILTLLLALKAAQNKKWLVPFSISFSLLVLTKTVVPLTIIPTLVLVFWKSKVITIQNIKKPILIFIAIVGSWFVTLLFSFGLSFINRYLWIGLPQSESKSSLITNFHQIKEYLHNGVGKWFWPGILGLVAGSIFFQKRFLILSLFALTFFGPFLFSSRGQIWHLVPLGPFLILAFFGFSHTFLKKFIKQEIIILCLMGIIFVYFYFPQLKRNWYQFVDIPAYISDEAILSREAGKFSEPFFIDGDYDPAAVFYSQKHVEETGRDNLVQFFNTQPKFVLITYQWRLDQAQISSDRYTVLKKDRDKVLIKKN